MNDATSDTQLRRGEGAAEELAHRLDRPMGILGLFFVLVVTGQLLATGPAWSRVFSFVGWILWAAFAGEFAVRAYIAQDHRRFWRRNWWQLIFLALPFLRFARAFTLLRTARIGGVLGATVRGSRSAGRLLSGRLGWLGTITAVIIVGFSQLLFVTDTFTDYGRALHGAALAAITGQPLAAEGVIARYAEVALGAYSVVVFATLAASLGAFFLQQAPVSASDPIGTHAESDRTGTPI